MEARRAPSRHCRDARAYGDTTTATHGYEYTPPPRHPKPPFPPNPNTNVTPRRPLCVRVPCALFSADIETEAGVASRLGVIYMSTMFVGVICLQTVVPSGAKERIVFYREQASPPASTYCIVTPTVLQHLLYPNPYCFTAAPTVPQHLLYLNTYGAEHILQ